MARFRWQVLSPGTRCVGRNSDGSKRFETFTPGRIKRYHQMAQEFLAKGRDIPVVLSHNQPGNKPRKLSLADWEAERRKGTIGRPDKFELDSNNTLWAEGEVPHADDAKTVENVRYCSPEICDFLEQDGTEYPDVLTHIAVTPRPVQIPQVPVTRMGNEDYVIRLAVDEKTGEDMADEAKVEEKKEEKKDDKTPEKKEDGEGVKMASPELIQAIRDCGYAVPEEVKTENELIIALKAIHNKDGEDDDDEMDDYGDEVGTVARPAPISMSIEEREQKFAERQEKSARKDLLNRLDGLRKKITPHKCGQIEDKIKRVRLSFDDEGNLKPNVVTVELATLEEVAKGDIWHERQPDGKNKKRTRLGHDDVGLARRPDHAPQDDPEPAETPEARESRMKALDEMGVKR